MAKTIAEETYKQIIALTSSGMKLADAIRKLADDNNKTEGAIRASYYTYSRKAGASPRTRSRRPSDGLSVDDALSGARELLHQAISAVDRELNTAKATLDAAQARYDELASTTNARKADLEAKLKALST